MVVDGGVDEKKCILIISQAQVAVPVDDGTEQHANVKQ